MQGIPQQPGGSRFHSGFASQTPIHDLHACASPCFLVGDRTWLVAAHREPLFPCIGGLPLATHTIQATCQWHLQQQQRHGGMPEAGEDTVYQRTQVASGIKVRNL